MAFELEHAVPAAVGAGSEIAFICDDRGNVLSASDTVSELLGARPGALVGEPLARLAVPGEEGAVAHALAAARQDGSVTFPVRLRAADGSPIDLTIAAWCLRTGNARVTFCLMPSSLERLRRAEERARVLADTQRAIATVLALALEEIPLDDLLARTLDLILSIPWLSIQRKGAIFLVEDEPDTLVMKVSRGLNPSLRESCDRVAFGTCLCGLAARDQTAIYASDLDERHTVRYCGIVPHGHYCVPICSEGMLLGVINTYLAPGHERSEVELEFLATIANTLAGVLARRRIDAERHRAENASRRKSELLALVSHEFLTPVTAVMLSCERLQRDRDAPLPPRQAEIVSRMRGALARLASTIRLLLEHARLDTDALQVRHDPLDVAVLAAEVVDEVRSAAERKGLTVRLELESPLPPLHSDARLLRIVLSNLTSNAVKFTNRGTVSVSVGYRDGAHRIAVRDTGPGIPTAERRHIFDAFEPLEPLANKHVPGLGLGLPLARRLADALGGRLELDSNGGRGSTFVVTLPDAAPASVTFPGAAPANGVALH